MHIRLMVGAFLICQNKVLLMKRNMDKKIAPGLWSCIGGHLEPEELRNPRKIDHISAIYREIKEEAGISQAEILDLNLRYIATRIDYTENEIRMVYYYFGKVGREFEPPYCNEGVLRWVDINIKDIIDLPMSFSVKEIIKHWINNLDNTNVFLVGMNKNNDKSAFIEL